MGRIGIASGQLASASINIADVPNVNVLEIRAIARRLKAMGKLDMIVIDYLQLIKGTGRGDNRQQEISDISRSLKGIAGSLIFQLLLFHSFPEPLNKELTEDQCFQI